MIRLDDKLNLEGYGLLLLNNKLTITKTIKNEYILIDDSIELEVMDNFVYSHHNTAFAFIGINE